MVLPRQGVCQSVFPARAGMNRMVGRRISDTGVGLYIECSPPARG